MSHLLHRWVRDHGATWLDDLVAEKKISVSRDGDLASLKYDQIESPMSDPLVCQLRGVVVRVSTAEILAWPYDKFWNHGESRAAPIDWTSALVLDKLDGSLAILYHDGERWRWASSGNPTAGGSFGATERTFADAFWDAFELSGMRLPGDEFREVTFMFEYVGPENRIVCRYPAPKLILHGARSRLLGQESPRHVLSQIADEHAWELVGARSVGLAADSVLAAAEALDPIAHEGFIVVDRHFNRVKVKSPRYVALHHLRGEATPRRAIELWKSGEVDELLAHFPELAPSVDPVIEALSAAAFAAVIDYQEHGNKESQKDFAIAVKDKPWSAVTFHLRKELHGRDTAGAVQIAEAAMRNMSTAALERMVAAVDARDLAA